MTSNKIGPSLALAGLVALFWAAPSARADTWYVATSGNDASAGTQAAPFKTIQKGIDRSVNGDTVQVSAGTYSEHVTWSTKNLAVLGAGMGKSIIDGGGSERSVVLIGVPFTALLQGFTIQNGRATSGNTFGGGLYLQSSSPIVWSCRFSGNQAKNGGGLYDDGGGSAVVYQCEFNGNNASESGAGLYDSGNVGVYQCTFSNNNAPGGGGGLYGNKGSPMVADCTFSGNYGGSFGGGIALVGCSAFIVNGVFTGNHAVYGGAVFAMDAGPHLTNCTFSGNWATNSGFGGGGAVAGASDGRVELENCILWGDSSDVADSNEIQWTIGYNTWVHASICCIQGGYGGTANISTDPRFIGGGNYRLQSSSPCRDMGSAGFANLPAGDRDGAPRIMGSAPDMGAYELWLSSYGQFYVDKAAGLDTNTGSPTAPFKTVTRAIGAAAAGNSLYIKQGNYGTDRPRITKFLHLRQWQNSGPARIGQP